MLRQIYYSFVFCIVLSILLELSQLFTLRYTKNIDKYWKSLALWENNNFIIWTFYTFILMVILRPTQNINQLEEINKLLDETLTEVDEIEMPDR